MVSELWPCQLLEPSIVRVHSCVCCYLQTDVETHQHVHVVLVLRGLH